MSQRCLRGVSEVSRRCLGGVWEVSRRCLGGVSEVSSGRCLVLEQDDAPAAEGHGSEHRGRLAPESTAVRAAVSVSCECICLCVAPACRHLRPSVDHPYRASVSSPTPLAAPRRPTD